MPSPSQFPLDSREEHYAKLDAREIRDKDTAREVARTGASKRAVKAPLSVVLGCISMVSILPMFICFWVAVGGLVFGGIGYKDRRGMAIAGIILSSLGLIRSALLAIPQVGDLHYRYRSTALAGN